MAQNLLIKTIDAFRILFNEFGSGSTPREEENHLDPEEAIGQLTQPPSHQHRKHGIAVDTC